MKSTYKQLGQFIKQVDVRNTDCSETNLLGVSVQKKFIPSIANTVGTDFSKYKLVKKGQFTYIPDTSRRGDKIGIALLKDYESGIVSNVYTVFEVMDTKQLIPEYLMLWFNRAEFDRFSRYKSHGSVREVFDWGEFCKTELPVLPYEEQLKIVNEYNTIANRIELKKQINDNLVYSVDSIFSKMFLENPAENTIPFTDIVQLMGGGTPKTDEPNFWDGEIPFFTPKDVSESPFCIATEKNLTQLGLNSCSSKLYPPYTTFVTCRGTVGNLSMAGVPMAMNQSCYALKGKTGYPPLFIFAFTRYVIATMKKKASGAVFSALVTRDFEMERVFYPSVDNAQSFQYCVEPLFNAVLENTNEIAKLNHLSQVLLSRLSSR